MQPCFPSLMRSLGFAVMALAMLGAAGRAEAADALIEGGKLCTQQFPVQERDQHIPTHLLAAISTTESGRWHKQLGLAVPWPWTINVEGKGYYFDTKSQAIAQVQHLMAQGYRSIDVGCMQVNLKHHAGAFADLNQAFEPAANVAYAAKFLRTNYNDLGDWIKATAAYHSRTEARGREYLVQIERSWNRIVAKVAEARASQGGAPLSYARTEPVKGPIKVADAAPEMTLNRPSLRPIASTHHVKVINVAEPRKPDILIIHGAETAPAAPQPEKVAIAEPVKLTVSPAVKDDTLIRPGASSIRRVALDNPTPPAQPSPASKSVFVN